MDQRVEVVIFVVRRERVDQAALERWLDATRHARTTVAVGLGCQPSYAADMIIQLPADDEISVPHRPVEGSASWSATLER
jgi:hypothetical protein